MKFRRVFAFLIVLAVLFCISGCGSTNQTNELEKDFLAGHSWGETENQFNSVKTITSIYGYDITRINTGFEPYLCFIEYKLSPVDSSDFEKLADKISSKCSNCEMSNYNNWQTMTGYIDSVRYKVSYKENDGYILISAYNDAYNGDPSFLY